MGDEELVEALGGVQTAKLSRTPRDDNNKKGDKQKEKEWPKELPRYFVGEVDMTKLIRGGWCSSSVAVIDFGVSYHVDKPPVNGSGIPLRYAPPEEAITRKNEEEKEEVIINLGPKSDIWALGVTLAELALGCFPFAKSPNDLLSAVDNMEMVMGAMPEPFRTAVREWYRETGGSRRISLEAVDMVTDPETGEKVLSPLSFSVKRWKARKNAIKNMCGYEDPISHTMAIGLHQSHTEAMAASIERQWAGDKTRLPAYGFEGTEAEVGGGQAPKKKVGDIESFRDLLLGIFKWMPENRAGMADILAHPWFADRYASSNNRKPEGLVSKLSQGMHFLHQHLHFPWTSLTNIIFFSSGTLGLINFAARIPFKVSKFFFNAFTRIFGIFSNPVWFLWGGRLRTNNRSDLEAQ